MRTIALQDANILIDLLNTGLFEKCLALNFAFVTTDLILAELYDSQAEIIKPFIIKGDFKIISTSTEDLSAITTLVPKSSKLSLQDWSAIYFAGKFEAILITGDQKLKQMAESLSIEVKGILWMLDQLIAQHHLSKSDGLAHLQYLLSKKTRLPNHECARRLRDWGE